MADVGNVIAPGNVAVITGGARGTGPAVAEQPMARRVVAAAVAATEANPPTPFDDPGAEPAVGQN